MAIVDRNGRLFGRLNLVDAILLLLAAGLVPLGYAAYLLFRAPIPVLTGVEPDHIPFGSQMQVTVRGVNLRPYMRVSFNEQQGRSFLFASATTAKVEIEDTLGPGVYDVVLYDQSQERSRLPKALTVTGSVAPTTEMVVVGMLSNLDADAARQIVKGMDLGGLGTVLEVGRPAPAAARIDTGVGAADFPAPSGLQVPVSVLVTCTVRTNDSLPRCIAGGNEVRVNRSLTLRTPLGALPMQIDQVRSSRPLVPVRLRVRFSGDPGALGHIAAGDSDLGRWANALSAGGRVVAAAAVRRASDQSATRDVDLVVQAQASSTGWFYGGDAVRIGGSFTMRTTLVELTGQVIDVSPAPPVDER